MFRSAPLVLALVLGAGCGGGPRVNRSLAASVPAAAMAPADALDAQIAALGPQETARRSALRSAQGDESVLAIEARAAESSVTASKAALKAARQAGDERNISAARARLEQDEVAVLQAKAAHDRARAKVAMVEAQVALIEAQREELEARRQLRIGEAVNTTVEPYDTAPLDAALAQAESRHQRARERLARAEADYQETGGTPTQAVAPLAPSAAPMVATTSDESAPVAATSEGTPMQRVEESQRSEEAVRREEMAALAAPVERVAVEPPENASRAPATTAIERASAEAARARGEAPASVRAVTGAEPAEPGVPTLQDWLVVLQQVEEAQAARE